MRECDLCNVHKLVIARLTADDQQILPFSSSLFRVSSWIDGESHMCWCALCGMRCAIRRKISWKEEKREEEAFSCRRLPIYWWIRINRYALTCTHHILYFMYILFCARVLCLHTLCPLKIERPSHNNNQINNVLRERWPRSKIASEMTCKAKYDEIRDR